MKQIKSQFNDIRQGSGLPLFRGGDYTTGELPIRTLMNAVYPVAGNAIYEIIDGAWDSFTSYPVGYEPLRAEDYNFFQKQKLGFDLLIAISGGFVGAKDVDKMVKMRVNLAKYPPENEVVKDMLDMREQIASITSDERIIIKNKKVNYRGEESIKWVTAEGETITQLYRKFYNIHGEEVEKGAGTMLFSDWKAQKHMQTERKISPTESRTYKQLQEGFKSQESDMATVDRLYTKIRESRIPRNQKKVLIDAFEKVSENLLEAAYGTIDKEGKWHEAKIEIHKGLMKADIKDAVGSIRTDLDEGLSSLVYDMNKFFKLK